MAYDSRRHRVVLFGGAVSNPVTLSLDPVVDNGTWEWDGTAWTLNASAQPPPARYSAQMAYDPVRGTIVVHGGTTTSVTLADTWTYDGTSWTQVAAAGGPAMYRGGAAFDVASQTVLVFGGQDASGYRNQTLAWNGTVWTDRSLVGPSARPIAQQVVSTGDSVLAFSGEIGPPPQETWLLRDGVWMTATVPVISNGPPTGLDPGFLAYAHDEGRKRIVLYDGYFDGSATWELSSRGWEKLAATSPPPRSSPSMAYDPIAREVVMFGGKGVSALDETFVWNGTSWTQRQPALAPPPRLGAPMAFDGRHVTLFGGTSPVATVPGEQSDTWSWDGVSWIEQTTSPHPGKRAGVASAGYDPVRNELVLFGTFEAAGGGASSETWGFDGTSWTKKLAALQPLVERSSPLVWNAARKTLVMAGGNQASDAWEWDGSAWTHLSPEDLPPARDTAVYVPSLDGTGTFMYGGRINLFDFQSDQWLLRWEGDGPAAPACGDGACDAATETCATCSEDCSCTSVCGDYTCTAGEPSCPGDCP
jgi:hypothetical protein